MSEENVRKGRYSRNKGAQGERELAKILSEQFSLEEVRRGYVFCNESDVVGLKGIHVECKRVEKLNIEKAMEQAIRESEKRRDGKPTVFHRKNRCEWLVTMRLRDWVNLYKGGLENESNR